MSDITELFRTVGPDGAGDPAVATVDGDLIRGRAALTKAHRRAVVRRSMLATGTLVVAAAVAVTVTQIGGASSNHAGEPTVPPRLALPHPHHKANAVKLVDWTGQQLSGFTVDAVPAGWHLSTSTTDALLITADGSTDDNPDVFVDKLAVLTSSVDEHGLGNGDPVTVNGEPGRVDVQQGTVLLRYNDPNGFGVDIQAPPALHWTDAQIVAFAEGVHVTGNAVHSHG